MTGDASRKPRLLSGVGTRDPVWFIPCREAPPRWRGVSNEAYPADRGPYVRHGNRFLPMGSLPEGSDRKSVSRLHEYEKAVNPNIAGHRMSERARIRPLRTAAFFNRPDFAPSCHVVSGFLPADDEEKRGNEDDTDENVHHERHRSVPPSRAIFMKSIARRREAIKTPVNGQSPCARSA